MDRAEDSGLASAARAAFVPSGGRRNRRLTGLPGGAEAAGRLPLQRQLFPWSPSCWPTLQTGDMPASTTGTGQVTEISPCLLHWRPDVTAISTFSSSPKEALCPSTATAHCPLPQSLETSPGFARLCTVPSCTLACVDAQPGGVLRPSSFAGTADSRSSVLLPLSVPRLLPATLPPAAARPSAAAFTRPRGLGLLLPFGCYETATVNMCV